MGPSPVSIHTFSLGNVSSQSFKRHLLLNDFPIYISSLDLSSELQTPCPAAHPILVTQGIAHERAHNTAVDFSLQICSHRTGIGEA